MVRLTYEEEGFSGQSHYELEFRIVRENLVEANKIQRSQQGRYEENVSSSRNSEIEVTI